MDITITQAVGGHTVGKTITVTKGAGEYLVNAGYAEQVETGPTKGDGKPAGNASLEAWTEYALAQGKTEAELVDLKRDDIKDLFTE